MENVRAVARKFALKNALDFGHAEIRAVAGKVIAEAPEAKADMKAAMGVVAEVVAQVNELSKEQVASEASKFEFQAPKTEAKKILPELEGAIAGKVVMRMAPNPNGPMHIGHTRMAILNDEYVKKYGGTLILRFDDTDPKNEAKIPMKEAYGWDKEDLAWLGVEFQKFFTASSRLQVYYEYFEKLLLQGGAYICTCEPEEWKKLVRFQRKPCPCRSLSPQENLERWKLMLSWDYKQGTAVARVKTDLNLPNPAVVDWPAFRIIDQPQHPLLPREVRLWPLLDFAGAIDDHDYEVTNILRGKDLSDSENRQRELYKHFGWTYPHVTVYGKFLAEDFVISKSKISQGIQSGAYSGWDDPQLPTLRAFKKRGILPEAIRKFILDLGVSKHEVNADLDILYSENRRMIDEKARRFFFVEKPVAFKIKSATAFSVEIKNHPANVLLGTRAYSLNEGENLLEISEKDAKELVEGEAIRLKELCVAKIIRVQENMVEAEKIEDASQRVKIIQWILKDKSAPARVWMDTGGAREGKCEEYCKTLEPGTIVQFERMFFCRLDSIDSEGKLVFYYTHN